MINKKSNPFKPNKGKADTNPKENQDLSNISVDVEEPFQPDEAPVGRHTDVDMDYELTGVSEEPLQRTGDVVSNRDELVSEKSASNSIQLDQGDLVLTSGEGTDEEVTITISCRGPIKIHQP